jgi:hypothetical protein
MKTTTQQRRRRRFQSPTRRGFWRLWLAVCRREGIEPTDEKRHVLYWQALGYEKRQKDFGPKEWDLVFRVLKLRLAGLNPEGPERLPGIAEAGERARKVYAIEQILPEAYILAVARDKFGCLADWRNLPLEKLDQLRITLIERARAKKRAGQRESQQVTDSASSPLKSEIKGFSGTIIVDEINDDYYTE